MSHLTSTPSSRQKMVGLQESPLLRSSELDVSSIRHINETESDLNISLQISTSGLTPNPKISANISYPELSVEEEINVNNSQDSQGESDLQCIPRPRKRRNLFQDFKNICDDICNDNNDVDDLQHQAQSELQNKVKKLEEQLEKKSKQNDHLQKCLTQVSRNNE